MNKLTFQFSFLVLMVSTLSFGDVFTYGLKGYPKQDRSCYLQAKDIGHLFESATQVKVVHVECTAETETGYDFSVEYEAATQLDFTSTDYKYGGVYPRGQYDTVKICEGKLPQQQELFEKATGLKPVFIYCRKEEITQNRAWEVIITAVGKPQLTPTLGGFLLFTKPQNITYEELFNDLKTSLEKRGTLLSNLVFHSRFPMVEASIHYYSNQYHNFDLDHVTKVPSIEVCLAQAAEAKGWFKNSEGGPFSIFCGGPEFGEFELNLGTIDTPSFSYQNSVDKFNSFEECELSKKDIIKHYSGSTTKQILGGLCSRSFETAKYHVVIFKQSKK